MLPSITCILPYFRSDVKRTQSCLFSNVTFPVTQKGGAEYAEQICNVLCLTGVCGQMFVFVT